MGLKELSRSEANVKLGFAQEVSMLKKALLLISF
jgi:hypothetical protein